MKVVTVLEGEVENQNWDVIRKAYRNLGANGGSTPGLLGSYLLQDKGKPQIWRIVTTWESLELLEGMRAAVDTPGGVLVFREAGAEPTLLIFEVREEISI